MSDSDVYGMFTKIKLTNHSIKICLKKGMNTKICGWKNDIFNFFDVIQIKSVLMFNFLPNMDILLTKWLCFRSL